MNRNLNSSRRDFLRLLPALAFLAAPSRLLATVRRSAFPLPDHPEPRPGVDGIRCPCGCAGLPGNYSLLSCYEAEGMARFCDICQAAGRIAYEQHAKGATLAQIRRHVDGALAQ
jgi:hypothetical protein